MHHIFSNWMSGFKPRVRPDFLRGFYVFRFKLNKVVFTFPKILKVHKRYTSKFNTIEDFYQIAILEIGGIFLWK